MEGQADDFCCHGCEMAYAIIHEAGLERYYQERERFAPRPEPVSGNWAEVKVAGLPGGQCEARLAIDGLRCASCVWVTEHVLERTSGVLAATVSYATGRATLRWDARQVDLGTLARRIAALGYRPRPLGEESAPDRGLMLRLGVAAFAAMNIMLLAATIYAGWWGAMEPRFAALFRWATLVLATPVALWCAGPFFAGAWSGLRHGLLHMDLPIALGVAILYGHGLVATVMGRDAYLDSLAMLVALLLLGRVLESRGRRRAVEAATALVGTVPREARRVERSQPGAHHIGMRISVVAVSALQPGDHIDVGAGEELAADGRVIEGSGQVRMALLTGEAEPVLVGPGDRVVAGALLVDGALTVAVLVVACPCALALSQPLAAAAGLGAAARRGLLLRSSDALLKLGQADLAGLDKTGTVTEGQAMVTAAGDAALRIAAGLERYSTHPIARAITAEAAARAIPLPSATLVHETAGSGITGVVDGVRWALRSGGAGVVTLSLVNRTAEARESPVSEIHLGDAVRPDAREAVEQLEALGVSSALLTGDHADVARRIAQDAGVRSVASRVDPAGKAAWVRARQAEGHCVLFAGDGLNDGPALAAADVGIAMAGGAASSVLVADGIVTTQSLKPVVAGIRAARAASRAIRTSQRRALVYNVVAVSAAAAGLVNPLVAAILMPLSSGLVIWNAARVERAVRLGEPCAP